VLAGWWLAGWWPGWGWLGDFAIHTVPERRGI